MVRLHGAGCALIDNLYGRIDFTGEAFLRYSSRREGDGGLVPGHLVFAEDLAVFAQAPYHEILRDITEREVPERYNLGGPAIIPLAHVAQMRQGGNCEIAFAGVRGNDTEGERIMEALASLPLSIDHYRAVPGPSPSTDVLSDPDFDNGRGERTFVNRLGVAAFSEAVELPQSFFDADIVFMGGTALVPPIHDALDNLAKRARSRGSLIVITTVFDFRNEKRDPRGRWPLINDFSLVDLLVTDHVEALRISGEPSDEAALSWFADRGVSAAVITRGAEDVLLWSRDGRFAGTGYQRFPVCSAVEPENRKLRRPHDTTGCGDNFVGGVLSSLTFQMEEGRTKLDLPGAVIEGNVAGGYAATYLGGLYDEDSPGEKRREISRFRELYKKDLRLG
jgi:sugar/nucleoside kinase (ribokinase family)